MYNTLFLDRDGVLNQKIDDGYVLNESAIVILPGIPEFLHEAKRLFKQIFVVTNQRCIGRKMVSAEQISRINQNINKKTGSYINDFFVCPHLDEDACDCRKPKNGLFLQASSKYEVDFSKSWMIGDSESDLVPAKKLGIKTIYLAKKHSDFADVILGSTIGLPEILDKYVQG